MPTVIYWLGSWTSAGPAFDLQPGQGHALAVFGNFGDAVTLTAHPVVGAPGVNRILQIQDLRIQGDTTGRRTYFTVRNVGPGPVPGYGLAYSYIRL